ncbi:outer membrane protein assembly factor [Polaribacter vadi]|uniref:outer membrane protein assembly factor n=1 Tax=Polaribacter TaxID=52959 RepID=UPI001C09FC55|nr:MULTISPECIES: outer membrane protein assembly factor [Polaribacter]MBU3010873.1 outer membrane protein assembly factor [Polaribacter vadi]MDO6740685.1 outer membrane protein assembly factor [Polaribacter sp. 1_MG-2023]
MTLRKFLFFLFFLGCSAVILSQEKQIVSLKINGAKKVNIPFLKSIITSKEGQPLDSITLEKDIVLLKRLPAIGHAYYQVFYSDKNLYNVFIYIEENYTILPNINLWTATNNQFSYKLGLYDYNFLGRNITFGGFYQNNGFDSYAINFKAPNLFSKKWGLALNHQNWKSEEPLYFKNQSANYLYNNISVEALGLYQINLKHEINFGVNLFKEKYQYLSGATDPAIPQKLDLNKALLKMVYSFDSLDYFYQYISGFKSILYAQYVITENDFQNDFYIFWNDFFYFKRIKEKGNWANRLRFGLASNENTPFAPFAVDNNLNLRGVGILVDRGTGIFVLNTEYRHTVYDKKWLAIQTNVFTDFGSWRDPGGEFNDFFRSEIIRIYSGVGLRFISKKIYNATFRIDYGFSVINHRGQSKGGLVFGIGQYF